MRSDGRPFGQSMQGADACVCRTLWQCAAGCVNGADSRPPACLRHLLGAPIGAAPADGEAVVLIHLIRVPPEVDGSACRGARRQAAASGGWRRRRRGPGGQVRVARRAGQARRDSPTRHAPRAPPMRRPANCWAKALAPLMLSLRVDTGSEVEVEESEEEFGAWVASMHHLMARSPAAHAAVPPPRFCRRRGSPLDGLTTVRSLCFLPLPSPLCLASSRASLDFYTRRRWL